MPSQPRGLLTDAIGGAGAEDDPACRSKLECHVLSLTILEASA
jgi:hypothetical protein